MTPPIVPTIAFRSLFTHGRRSALLVGAIALVTALLILLLGLSNGIRSHMVHTATTLTTGHINIGGFFKVTAGQSAPVVTKYGDLQKNLRQWLPEHSYSVQRGRGWAKLVSDIGSIQAGVSGVDIGSEPEFLKVLKPISGRIEDLSEPNTIVVFEGQLEKLGVKVGDAITISAQTPRGMANTLDLRVVAIAKDVGLLSKWNVFVPIDTLRQLYQLRPDTTGAIHIHLPEDHLDDVPQLADRLRQTLIDAGHGVLKPDPRPFFMKFQTVSRQGWTGQKLDVTTWEDELAFMMYTLKALDVLSVVLTVIMLAIVVMGIMNTMWIAIRERTREIGTLRAIGMSKVKVLGLFLIEALLIGVLGAALGAALGTGVCVLVTSFEIGLPLSVQLFLMNDRLALTPAAMDVLGRVALIITVTGIAALAPSLRAARLRPIEAMTHN